MKKLFIFMLSALLALGCATNLRAESSSIGGDTYQSQQVFQVFYNSSGRTIASNTVVTLATNATASSNLGARITFPVVTAAIMVIGVADESITDGSLGRVCIRGPHQVIVGGRSFRPNAVADTSYPRPGDCVITSASPHGTVARFTSSKLAQGFRETASHSGIDIVGYRMADTNTNPATNSADNLIWIWIQPTRLLTYDQ